MPADDSLSQAMQLIQQGRYEEAQPKLQALIRANPQDLAAWSWFVKTCRTPEQRLQALEVCLKLNPGNPQISEAIQTLRSKLAPPAPEPEPEPLSSVWDIPPALLEKNFEPVSSPWDISPALLEPDSGPTPSPWDLPSSELEQQESAFEMYTPTSMREAETDMLPGYLAPPPSPEPVFQPETPSEPDKYQGLDEKRGRPFIWYDVWVRALTQPDVYSYIALLRDPLASVRRALGWIFLSSIISLIITVGVLVLTNVDYWELLYQARLLSYVSTESFNLTVGIITIILVPVMAALIVLGMMLQAAIYNFLAKFLGGSGNFSRTLYLLAAWTAPFTIITQILFAVPYFIGNEIVTFAFQCLSLIPAFYSFRLTIVSLQAAQRLNGMRSCLVIFLPGILILVLVCIFVPSSAAILNQIPGFSR